MEYSYKFRLYPNGAQINLIERTFGCCRYVYNHYLAKRQEVYKTSGNTFGYNACSADMTRLKKEVDTVWLQEVDATALQSSLRDLDEVFHDINSFFADTRYNTWLRTLFGCFAVGILLFRGWLLRIFLVCGRISGYDFWRLMV